MLDEPLSPPIRLGPLAQYAGYYLRLAQDASFQAFAGRVGTGDLRPGFFTLLTLIRENPGITQTAVSQASGRDKSTLTPALRLLEEGGYIERERVDRDRRSFQLYLTPAGEDAVAQLSEAARAHDAELDRIIGPENKARFIGILRDIVSGLAETQNRRQEGPSPEPDNKN
jgi:DNA-binding MarR family transcriptional regulator